MKKLSLAAAALACMLPLVAQSGQKINVKTGLWEMTMQTDMTGTPAMPAIPPDVLAKMSPEQRARLESMKSHNSSHVTQSCVTDKELEHGFEPEKDKSSSCKVTSVATTATTQEVHMQCDSERVKGTSVMKVNAPDREHVVADIKTDMVSQGQPISVTVHMNGKWVSSDCGAVKPSSHSD